MLLNFRFNAFYQAEPTRRTDSNGLATENYGLPWRPSLTSVCVCVCMFSMPVLGAHLELLLLVLRPLSTVDKVQFFLMCFYLWQMRKKSMDSQGTWVLQIEVVGGAGKGAGNCLLDTGQDGAVIDCALFVAVIALPQMTHTQRTRGVR